MTRSWIARQMLTSPDRTSDAKAHSNLAVALMRSPAYLLLLLLAARRMPRLTWWLPIARYIIASRRDGRNEAGVSKGVRFVSTSPLSRVRSATCKARIKSQSGFRAAPSSTRIIVSTNTSRRC